MKTVGVRESDDGAGQCLEIDGWTPWQYYVPEEELEPYYRDANALMMKLERIEVRCPVKGCLLATLYWMPRRPTAGSTRGTAPWKRFSRSSGPARTPS